MGCVHRQSVAGETARPGAALQLIISVSVSLGGTTMPPALQTEFGVGSLWVTTVALARLGRCPSSRKSGARAMSATIIHPPEPCRGRPAPGRPMVEPVPGNGELAQTLDNIQALALAFNDRASPFRWLSTHPIEGMMLNCHVRRSRKLLAGQPRCRAGRLPPLGPH